MRLKEKLKHSVVSVVAILPASLQWNTLVAWRLNDPRKTWRLINELGSRQRKKNVIADIKLNRGHEN